MYHMIKYWLNCIKHISFVIDGVWYQLLIEICIRASLLAKKTIDFRCSLSHWSRLERNLPQQMVQSHKAKETNYLINI